MFEEAQRRKQMPFGSAAAFVPPMPVIMLIVARAEWRKLSTDILSMHSFFESRVRCCYPTRWWWSHTSGRRCRATPSCRAAWLPSGKRTLKGAKPSLETTL